MKKFRKPFIIILSLGILSAMTFFTFENYKWLNEWNYVEEPAETPKIRPILTTVGSDTTTQELFRKSAF